MVADNRPDDGRQCHNLLHVLQVHAEQLQVAVAIVLLVRRFFGALAVRVLFLLRSVVCLNCLLDAFEEIQIILVLQSRRVVEVVLVEVAVDLLGHDVGLQPLLAVVQPQRLDVEYKHLLVLNDLFPRLDQQVLPPMHEEHLEVVFEV